MRVVTCNARTLHATACLLNKLVRAADQLLCKYPKFVLAKFSTWIDSVIDARSWQRGLPWKLLANGHRVGTLVGCEAYTAIPNKPHRGCNLHDNALVRVRSQ